MVINWLSDKFKAIVRELNDDEALDDLVSLIQVAQDNEEVRRRLVAVLSLSELDRQKELDLWIESCQSQGAPEDFVQSIKMLRDPYIAERALKAIESE